jgi:hypothetical protein
MTNPTATERARVARASGRSGYRSASSIRRALAPIDLLIDLMAFLLSPLGWALKAMRERIGALLAHKLAAQLRRTLAHAGIPIPALCDVDLIFWVSRTKPLLRDQNFAPTGEKRKGLRGAHAERADSISIAPSPLAPIAQFAREGDGSALVSDHPYTAHLSQFSGADDRSRIRGPPWPAPKPQPQTALGLPKCGRWCWRLSASGTNKIPALWGAGIEGCDGGAISSAWPVVALPGPAPPAQVRRDQPGRWRAPPPGPASPRAAVLQRLGFAATAAASNHP